jgi:DNA (cytosine-5)-methyltransferase 1
VTDPTVLELFAGIGGLSLGLQRAGFAVVGQVEIDPFCRSILARHWPEVPRHDDVRTAPAWWRSRPRPQVDLIAGGFPCQPVSNAGRKLGTTDPRWLWPAMADVIAAVRPGWAVIENVPGLRTRGLAAVLSDLAGLGYRTAPGTISACAMGAPHTRTRLFVLAHAEGLRCGQGRPGRPAGRGPHGPAQRPAALADPQRLRSLAPRRHPWPDEPRVDRVAYGVPSRVDRTRALGNAVVPAAAEHIGRLIIPHITTREGATA